MKYSVALNITHYSTCLQTLTVTPQSHHVHHDSGNVDNHKFLSQQKHLFSGPFPAVSLRVQSGNVRKLVKKRNMLGKRSGLYFRSFFGYGRCELYPWFYSFRSRNNLRHSGHGARQRQTRSRRSPPWVSHVKIVIMRQALGGRRISRIDMPPQAESIEIVYRIVMKTLHLLRT